MFRPLLARGLPALCLLALLSPRPARGDGCLLPRAAAADIAEPEQKAVVVFDAGREDLILQVRYAGNPAEFGWLVPLPAEPRITPERHSLFEWLSRGTQKPALASSERVARVLRSRGRHFRSIGMESVQVVRRDTLGVYDTVTLSADHGDALKAWLAEHDFRAPPDAGPVLEGYARRHWYFVAMRIVPARRDSATAAQLAGGTLQAMRFQFDTERPVFPLKISALNGGPSELLIYTIARQQLVAAGGGAVAWRALHCGPGFAGLFLPPGRFPGLDRRDAVVSKLRAVFRPEQMDDLTFVPYDPRADLGSRDTETRAMAASCAGRLRDAACVPGLLNILRHTWWPGRDAVSALWALGQIGGPDATACLLRWARGFSTLHRVEALEALAHLRDKRVLPILLGDLRRWAGPNVLDPWGQEETRAALDHVIALGDATCLPELSRIAARHAKPAAWEKEYERRPAIGLVAAQAACGDSEACRDIVRALVRQGRKAAATPALIADAERGGSINGFPSGFWTGYDILEGSGGSRWGALQLARDYLASRPEVLDALLRRAACDPVLPDAGRIVALAALKAAAPADLDSLDALWRRALRPGAPVAMIPMQREPGASPTRVRYNLNASSVAYAFARLGACDRLETLWRSCPAGDSVLLGEIAVAAAHTDSARLAPLVLGYVSDAWDAAARRQAAHPEPRRDGPGAARSASAPGTYLDFDYRMRAITRFMNDVVGDRAERRALMTDRRLAPAVRRYWIANVPCCTPAAQELGAAAAEARQALMAEEIHARIAAEAVRRGRTDQ